MGPAALLIGRRPIALAFALGALAALGQAPWKLQVCTLLGLAGVVWLLRRAPDIRSAFLTGLAAGTGHFAVALSWIVEPFFIDIATQGWMAPFAVVFLSVGLGLFWAGAAAAAARMPRPTLGFVATFAAFEWLRGVVFSGFPWATAGHVWIGTPLDQLAAVLGPSGLTLVTLAVAALPVALGWRGLVGSAVLLSAVAGFGSWRLSQPLPPDLAITLRLVQPNAAQSL
jgi:apolipoprotein N-acyltransferase